MHGVLVACMPKSGSTFLSGLVAELPGFRRASLVPSFKRREQEIGAAEIVQAFEGTRTLRQAYDQGSVTAEHRPRGFVAQHHVKHNAETQRQIDDHGLVPVCLVRNIFDVVVSFRDHVEQRAPYTAAAYIDETMRGWPPERMHAFLVDLAVPWYIHFYVSWFKADHKLVVTYEDLIKNPRNELWRITKFGGLGWNDDAYVAALERTMARGNRFNVGVPGRGAVLSDELRAQVHRYCSYYPDVDFGPIGVDQVGGS